MKTVDNYQIKMDDKFNKMYIKVKKQKYLQQVNMNPINQAKTPQTIKPKFKDLLKIVLLLIFIGAVLTVRFTKYESTQFNYTNQKYQPQYALIGDIGGTNIRYQLVQFYSSQKNNYTILKQQRMKVKDYDTFQISVQQFLYNVTLSNYPYVAVIAMAGPIYLNTVSLSNVPKWGRLNGTQLTTKFNISQFLFINDFQAVSYGLLIVDNEEFVQLNDKKIDQTKIRGVIGPGTGLGHSIILNNPQIEDGIIVLPSQAGHSDATYIDEETVEYLQFLKVKYGQKYIDVQKAFCGPSIPYMLEFYSQKYPITQNISTITSQQIVVNIMNNNSQLAYQKVYEMFMKFYSSAIANFMIQHMTTGGVYLVGGLTKSLIQKIKQKDILEDWKLRHPQMLDLIESMPIVFSNQVDLGLKGAFVMSTRFANKALQSQMIKIENEDVF